MHEVSPKITPFTFGDVPLNYGEPASAQCFVTTGDLPLNIQWLFDEHELPQIPGLTVTSVGKRISLLNFESVSATHAGIYKCIAENSAGIAVYSAELRVNGLLLSTFNLNVHVFYFCSMFIIFELLVQ